MQLVLGTPRSESLDARSGTEGYEMNGLGGNDVLYGSAFDDLIIGGVGADQSFGGEGNDTFVVESNDTFADIIKGEGGFDTILGSASDDVLLLNIINSIERIDGSGGVDILRGHSGSNYWNFAQTELIGIYEIDAGAGNDQITGSSGDERIKGGPGNDTLDGGPGSDTAVYVGHFAAYTLTTLSNGSLHIATSAYDDGADTIRNFERIEFADGIYADGVFTPFGDPTNTVPSAQGEAYAAIEDQALIVNAVAGLLANDTDPDDDALSVSAFDALSNHGGNVAVNADGSFVYTPQANFNGVDSFSYIVSDGRGGTATASVTIDVAAVNDAPIAADNPYSTTQNNDLVVNAATGVLANDTDPDQDTLTVTDFDALTAQGGSVAMNANGSFVYTPPTDFTGIDTFSYTVSDVSSSDTATVSISVSPTYVPASAFEAILIGMPENEWVRLNVNEFRDVWTPVDQRPGTLGSPGSIILAWGSAAWDSNRDEYIIWGGGHANYAGNEVYTWSAASLQWERASLPSAIAQINEVQTTADGFENSPLSSHAYDNLEFLAIADRLINFGGAAMFTGTGFLEDGTTIKTGPYLWDPSKADPNKVGGLTGSHVNAHLYPDVIGGEMWENRRTWNEIDPAPGAMIMGTTDYAQIDGKDVVFVNPYNQGLYKYTIHDVDDPSQDTWERVGNGWDTFAGQGAGAYDSSRNIYVRTSKTEFTFWDLNNAGPSNRNASFVPEDASGEFVLGSNWGMEYDPVRERFVLWEGDASVWYLQPPENLGATGWTLEKAPTAIGPAPTVPTTFRGVLGKWDYVDNYDVFIGLTDHITGDIWAYKPEDWTPPNWLV